MLRRLPPLNALRAFEAAALQMSFTQAGKDLNVTQAAVSYQIRILEESLGVPLFARYNKQLKLTDEGRAFLPRVREALDKIEDAITHVREQTGRQVITVCTSDSFAVEWLVPRLKSFNDTHPGVDVWISTWSQMESFQRDNVDIEIRYGLADWPDDKRTTLLLREEVFPVCSPELFEKHRLNRPSDLANCTLLHEHGTVGWSDWLREAGAEDIDCSCGPRFTHSNLMILAAAHSLGVGLGRSVLVADALANGQLLKPFSISLPIQYAYYIVCRSEIAELPKIKGFTNWLLEKALDQAS
jgi:LysR family glycine cleavage system transcriptional activator